MNDLSVGEGAAVEDIAPSELWNLLGIPGEVPPTERVRLLLQQLDHADYMPPTAWYDVLELLADANPECAGTIWHARPALSREFEDRLRTEIDELATRFWDIAPTDRLPQWNGLAQRSRCWPSLRARLALLEPGLALDLIAIDVTGDERVTRLAQSVVQLFALDATSRGQSIGAVLGSMVNDPHAWEEAAQRLSRDRPEIARLVPEFLAAVTTLCDHEREENLRYEARNRETAEDAEWETYSLFDYLNSLRVDCILKWITRIALRLLRLLLIAVNAFLLLILKILDSINASSAGTKPPEYSSSNGDDANATRVDACPRAESTPQGKPFPATPNSEGAPVE